jgi:hypothetical protein
MIVQLKKQSPEYPDLSTGRPYAVIGIEADDLRVLNDAGRPYLYPRELFNVLDDRMPQQWITETGDEGELYAYPEPLNNVGFFEDFFDRKPEAVSQFWGVINRLAAAAAA